MDPKRKVLGHVSRADIVPGTAPFNDTLAPNVAVRAKISSFSTPNTTTGSTTKVHASPSIQRSRSPVRSAPGSRPMSVLSSPSALPPVRATPSGNDTSGFASNIGFVPKAKKSTVSLVATGSASTPPPNLPGSGLKNQKPTIGRGVLTPSNSNSSTPRNLSPVALSRYQARSPTPTSRLREQTRPRTGSISEDSRRSHLSSKLSSSNMSSDAHSHPDEPEFDSTRYASGKLTMLNSFLPPNGNDPPVRLRAKLSNISLSVSTPATPQRSPGARSAAYITPSSPPSIPTTSITKPSPSKYTPFDSILVDNLTSPRRRLSLSSTSLAPGTPLGHRRTSSGVYRSRGGAATPPLPATEIHPGVNGAANSGTNNAVHHQRESTNDTNVPRSPVSSTLSSSSVASGRNRSDSQTGYSLKLFPPDHSRSGSDLGSSIVSSSSMSSGRTTSMINGVSARGARSTVFSISRNKDEVDRKPNHKVVLTRAEGVGRSGIGTLGDFAIDNAKSDAFAAKTSRKIADLEITNKSLLAINAMLETDKHRLSKEIRDLRRRLREQRLSLPPQAYRALVRHEQRAAALSPSAPGQNPASTEALPLALGQTNIFADEDDDEDLGDEEDLLRQPDPAYERVTALVDALVYHATEALSRPATLRPASPFSAGDAPLSSQSGGGHTPGSNVGPKVLSPNEVEEHYELKWWKGLGLNEIAMRPVDGASMSDSLDGTSSAGEADWVDPALVPLPDTADLTDSSIS